MSTRTRLEGTVLAPVDLDDQEPATHIFLIDTASGGRQAFRVDFIDVIDGVVYGMRHNLGSVDTVVVAVPRDSAWTLLSCAVVKQRSVEESIRKTKADQEAELAILKEVYPPKDGVAPPMPAVIQGAGQYL